MHRVGTKPGLIPKPNLAARGAGLPGNGGEPLAPPVLDRLGIALIGPLQRLLRGQPQLGKQGADRRHAEPDAQLALDQVGHDRARPQPEV